MRHLPSLKHSPSRAKRTITKMEQFFMITFPLYGTGKAANELIHMASALEQLPNVTAAEARELDRHWLRAQLS
ncbi:hypothetical protein scyTo_0006913 [Scyliorhinus torazame]|uniref:Uncharacterized protein n=1 Tax=Scyliorhinus torazame TaxID=75743 RepID=A0A401NIK9_SCYTO|nr:hypothetical protein [Scyliorhinus torazame]